MREGVDRAALPTLPALHRDPLDGAPVCQATSKGLTPVTVSAVIRVYPVGVLAGF
jgi:PIN domain nuclease of toxin-antitoxin system